jgi:predicted TIM-barrel fold metal-dependent hydrolase
LKNKHIDNSSLELKHYAGIRGLAELPYFEMTDDGLLRLTVDGLNSGVDGHTHFAINALDGPKPDLLKRYPETKYYLDIKSPILMNNYMGQNNTEQDLSNMTMSMLSSITPEGSVFTNTHTIPNLIAEMDLLNIDKTVVLPIAYGFPYGDDITEWYMDAIERSGKKDRFIICGSVKPTLPDAVEKTKQLKLKGVKGIKVHPNLALFTPNDRLAWAFYEECSQLDLPLLLHCGLVGKESADPDKTMGYTGRHADINNFFEPITAFPRLRFVLCHSGGLQNDIAIDIARKNENVWLDIQGQSVGNIRKMIKELGPERLMFGSDWPFFAVASLLSRLLIATEGDNTVRKMIYSENSLRFWGLK